MIVVGFLLRVALGLVFLRAGAIKLCGREEFRRAVGNYKVLPGVLVGAAAVTVPSVELIAGGLVLVGIELRPAAAALAMLLVAFSVAIAVNLLRGRTFPCGCSGRIASDISWRHVIRNFALAGAAVVVALWAAEPLAVLAGVRDGHESARWSSLALAWLLILGSLLVGALLAVEADRVRRLLRPDAASVRRWR
jgi:putative oxidoreductase